MPGPRAPLADRLWAKVDRSAGPDSCHPWTGAVNGRGRGKDPGPRYGHLRVGGRGTPHIKAHVAVLLVTVGPCPAGQQACHAPACTTTLCCNDRHLRWGTVVENMHDRTIRRDLRTQAELMRDTLDRLEADGLL